MPSQLRRCTLSAALTHQAVIRLCIGLLHAYSVWSDSDDLTRPPRNNETLDVFQQNCQWCSVLSIYRAFVFIFIVCPMLYAWTEYKFTCVCEGRCRCVCPSHFLWNRLQVRPLHGFLKDTDLRKDVPFGGLDDEWSKVHQSPHFGGLCRHFKPSMRKIQIPISSDLCIRLTWNLTGSCGQQQRLRGWSRMVVKQFQDGGWPPFWKSI